MSVSLTNSNAKGSSAVESWNMIIFLHSSLCSVFMPACRGISPMTDSTKNASKGMVAPCEVQATP
jgi:hypothetical protein